jgi:glycerol-3-phosphate dehydrogenase
LSEQFDLIVVGGGINGAGIARDAALRGLSTCLVEQGDLCNSTTRWSSRLIHGGLRYLEYGELGLVHESLQERETLLRNAPHLVRPLPLLLPVYDGGRRGLKTVDFGLYVYDLLSIGRSVPGHRRLGVDEARAAVPALATEGLEGAALYYDAQVTFAERLVVENALAAREAGADVRTWTRAERILLERNHVTGVELVDTRTGATETIHAQVIVNAAGPWADRVLARAGRPLPRFLGPTKGTHIVLAPFAGLAQTACYAEAAGDGRPFFIIPWNGLVLIGTTDTRYDHDPGDVLPTEAEVDYLLSATRHVLPGATLTRDQLLYAYSGVRPLPRQGLRDAGAITRRHQVRHHGRSARGLSTLVGGKLTTYRHLAEEVVDEVASRGGLKAGRCRTAELPLPGGERARDDVLRELSAWPLLSVQSRQHLYDVYGARAPAVAALTTATPGLAQAIDAHSGAIGAEIIHAVRAEMAQSLGDILLRRAMLGLGPDLGRAALEPALSVAKQHLDWNTTRVAAERAAYLHEISRLQPV